MNKKLFFAFCFGILCTAISYGQNQYPSLRSVTFVCRSEFNSSERMFYYRYDVTNGITSTGNVSDFRIDISESPNEVAYDTVGLRYEDDGYTEGAFRRHYPSLAGRIIPVGFPSAPGIWIANLSDDRTVAFNGDSRMLIKPGDSLGGFVMMSKGLPGIRRLVVSPDFDPTEYFPDPEVYPESDTVNIDSLYGALNYYGYTVGPTAPPLNFNGTSWLDTLTSYATQSRSLGWIKDQATADKYSGYFASAKTSLQQNNTAAARSTLQQVLQQVNIDSTSNLTSEAYALIRYNTEYLIAHLPTSPSGFAVKLISSTGTMITTGSLQYYEGSWKDATNNNDGTFSINTTAKTLSLRMTYEYGTQTKSNVTVGPDTAVFQTVNAQIKLQDSRGNPIDTGTVQYYAGAWRSLGMTSNGTATKELLPNNYTFRMTYAFGNNDKAQDISVNPAVIFQTVNATVQLKNSQENLIDQGTVQYYAGAWRSFGVTSSGVAAKELLPANYTFRMTYESVSNDKAQDISTNSTVAFSTILCTISVKDSQGQPVNNVQTSYYSGAWRQIGSTVNGQVTKELLPVNLSFRITYGTNHQDKTQNLSTSSLVEFTTP